jgi:precorrin-2 dehydrogenase/sirohydrochlorin ferrochelatase
MAHHQYPEVEGGGSLILAWQVKNKKVLVIGGGEVSLDHHRSIRSHGEKS